MFTARQRDLLRLALLFMMGKLGDVKMDFAPEAEDLFGRELNVNGEPTAPPEEAELTELLTLLQG